MTPQDLQRKTPDANLLSILPDLDRLLRTMACWWEGASWARIADAEGISRQRVGRLLATVGCTRSRRCKADHNRPDSPHHALLKHVIEARAGLLHPLANRLTIRQRAAFAWLAQGLRQSDIARRMVTTPQNVRHLIVAARWRLERLSRPKPRKRARCLRLPKAVDTPSPPRGEDIPIEWPDPLSGSADPLRSAERKIADPGGSRRPGATDVATLGAGRPQDANRASVGRCGGRVAFRARPGSPDANGGQRAPRGGLSGRRCRGGLAARVHEAAGDDKEVEQ